MRYPPIVHAQTHPNRLFVNATLFGLNPAPVARCRVLELGCGDASNLIAIAIAHPESQCVGIDTSGEAIADGRKLAEEVGAENVSLLQTDVMEIGADFGEFDYVIAHGLYSWVPPEVREKVMEVCRANLAPDGVAYVSYNVYPGAHLRQMYRGMMTYHVRQFADPMDKVRQSRAMLQFLAESHPPQSGADGGGGGQGAERPMRAYALRRNELYRQLIRNELDHMAITPPAMTFHDDLAPFNTALHFHEFAAHAQRHGLQYLSEAEFIETQPPVPGAPPTFPAEVMRVLDQVPRADVIAREQYADFVKCRQFRQTLLCHAAVAVARPPVAQRVTGLYAAGMARPVNPNLDLRSATPETFEMPNKGTFNVNLPLAKAALAVLGEAWPRRVHFDELAEQCRARLGAAPEGAAGPFADTGGPTADTSQLGDFLLTAYAANIVGLHAYAPQMQLSPGEKPVGSRLARAQVARRPLVSNLWGTTVDLSGPVPGRLLRLLDGTRDRDALARDLADACIRDGQLRARNGVPITDPTEMAGILRAELDEHLATMAQLGLLEG